MSGRKRPDLSVAVIERAMVRLRRSVIRRRLSDAVTKELDVDLQHVGVVDAIEEGPRPGTDQVNVGDVAERLAIDPSRASRIVAAAVKAGYISRVASQTDGRRIGLELTQSGRELVEAVHGIRRSFLERRMRGWTIEERRQFARLLTKFTAVDSIENETGPRQVRSSADS
jgi:DNA-binding MarR family transcriptional regulator